MNDELLIKFLLKETTAIENGEVEQWLAANNENALYFEQLEKIWIASGALAQTSEVDVDKAWLAFKAKAVVGGDTAPIERPLRRNFAWISIAAAFLIGVGAWGIYSLIFPNNYAQIGSGSAVITKVLPDGSELTINKNTAISYAKNFEKHRNVRFEKGEVFFNVAHDSVHPFVIEINNVDVEVVGTSFNIKHLKEETEVIVETGMVKVTLGNQTLKLLKNERIVIGPHTKKLKKEQNTDRLYNYYRTKIFDAKNTPLHKLIGVLNEAYGSKVVVDPRVKDLTIYIPLEFNSLDQNLKYICEALKLKIYRNQDEIKLSY